MARKIILAAAASFSIAYLAVPLFAPAQDAPAGADVENARHNFIGVINSGSVFVKSSPREEAYPTMKLEKGQKVTVVGIRYKWLKILPPEGSFAYVPKAYVNQRGDGKIGRATRETIAKVGSSLNELRTAPMAKIDEGEDVEILGEQADYYKIKPPEGTFLYVQDSVVDPVQALAAPTDKSHDLVAAKSADASGAKSAVNPPTEVARGPKPTTTGEVNESGAVSKTETPSVNPDASPATQPSESAVALAAQFDHLESDFKTASEKPITDQPIESLLSGYGELLRQDSLGSRLRQVSEVRVSTLKLRAQTKAEFVAYRESQVQAADRQKALVAEHEEIQQRIKEKQVTFYAAVGTLRASSIQRGGGMLFRLTDPTTGRTVAYIRTNDAAFSTMIGRFVGVKGTLTTDAALNMKLIDEPAPAELVDPSKVNDTIAAQIVPPSLAPRQPTARAAD